jgi:hypothetical protein
MPAPKYDRYFADSLQSYLTKEEYDEYEQDRLDKLREDDDREDVKEISRLASLNRPDLDDDFRIVAKEDTKKKGGKKNKVNGVPVVPVYEPAPRDPRMHRPYDGRMYHGEVRLAPPIRKPWSEAYEMLALANIKLDRNYSRNAVKEHFSIETRSQGVISEADVYKFLHDEYDAGHFDSNYWSPPSIIARKTGGIARPKLAVGKKNAKINRKLALAEAASSLDQKFVIIPDPPIRRNQYGPYNTSKPKNSHKARKFGKGFSSDNAGDGPTEACKSNPCVRDKHYHKKMKPRKPGAALRIARAKAAMKTCKPCTVDELLPCEWGRQCYLDYDQFDHYHPDKVSRGLIRSAVQNAIYEDEDKRKGFLDAFAEAEAAFAEDEEYAIMNSEPALGAEVSIYRNPKPDAEVVCDLVVIKSDPAKTVVTPPEQSESDSEAGSIYDYDLDSASIEEEKDSEWVGSSSRVEELSFVSDVPIVPQFIGSPPGLKPVAVVNKTNMPPPPPLVRSNALTNVDWQAISPMRKEEKPEKPLLLNDEREMSLIWLNRNGLSDIAFQYGLFAKMFNSFVRLYAWAFFNGEYVLGSDATREHVIPSTIYTEQFKIMKPRNTVVAWFLKGYSQKKEFTVPLNRGMYDSQVKVPVFKKLKEILLKEHGDESFLKIANINDPDSEMIGFKFNQLMTTAKKSHPDYLLSDNFESTIYTVIWVVNLMCVKGQLQTDSNAAPVKLGAIRHKCIKKSTACEGLNFPC